MIIDKGYKEMNHVLAFDLDNTLIETRSGNKFPKNAGDFKFTEVVNRINMDISIVIFTNQAYSKSKISKAKARVHNVIETFPRQIKPVCYVADKRAIKKPKVSLFRMFLEQFNAPKSLTFIGDAAGREGDFSDSDFKFAHNCAIYCRLMELDTIILFKTPEDFLDNISQRYSLDGFDPVQYIQKVVADKVREENDIKIEHIIDIVGGTDKYLIFTIGPPRIGKKTVLDKIAYKLDRDHLRLCEYRRSKKKIKNYGGNIVLLSGCNSQNRKDLYKMFEEYEMIALVWSESQIEVARHNDWVQSHLEETTEYRDVVFNNYVSKYEPPEDTLEYIFDWKFDCRFESKKETYYFTMRR